MIKNKYKISIVIKVFVLILMLSGCSFNVGNLMDSEPDFRNAKWGMTENQVIKSEDTSSELDKEHSKDNSLRFEGTLNGDDISIFYDFYKGKLIYGSYWKADYGDNTFTHEDANIISEKIKKKLIKKKLIKKYGEPEKDEEGNDIWEVEDTLIKLEDNSDHDYAIFNLSYSSKEYIKQVEKDKNKSINDEL